MDPPKGPCAMVTIYFSPKVLAPILWLRDAIVDHVGTPVQKMVDVPDPLRCPAALVASDYLQVHWFRVGGL